MFNFFKNNKILNKKVFALVFLCGILFSHQNVFSATTVDGKKTTTTNDQYYGEEYQNFSAASGLKTDGEGNLVSTGGTNGGLSFNCGNLALDCWLSQISFNSLVRGSAWIMGLGGQLFDSVITYTIIEAKSHMFPSKDSDNFINKGWEVFRDIVNVMFIFVILYIGIMTIIKGTEFGTKKLLTAVIAVAILLNFSLFFTKIFIDIGNIVAVNLNEVLKKSVPVEEDKGIATYIIGAFGFQTIYQLKDKSGTSTGNKNLDKMIEDGDWGGLFIYAVFASLVMLVVAVILLIASFMFLTRYIVLIFILIFSSAAVGSHILPALKKEVWTKWFSTLIGQTFFAPLFLLLFLVTAIVIHSLSSTIGGSAGWNSLMDRNASGIADSVANLLIPFIIIIGFLIGTIVFSKKLSDMGGGYAGTVTKIMGGAALGATAFAGRRLGGIAGGAIKNSGAGQFLRDTKFDNKLANYTVGALARATGRSTIKSANKLQNSTFDVRNAGFGISKLINKTGVSLGDASKKTFVSDVKEKQAKIEKDREIIYSRTKEEKAALDDRLKTEAEDAALAQELDELANPLSTISDIENRRLAAETAQNASEIALSRALADLNRTLANPTSTEKEIEVAKHKYNTIKETHSKNESEFKNIVAEKEKYRKETLETNTNAVAIKQSTHEIESVSPITGLNIPGLNKINKFRSASFANSSAVQSAISAANKKLKQSDNDKVLEALKALGK